SREAADAARGAAQREEAHMKIGVVLPQTEIGNEPVAIKAYAEAVEGMGFTHILVFDHVLGANPARPGGWKGPYTHRHGFHEQFVLFGFLAAATRRVELVTGIIILPQRQTALVAKQAAADPDLDGRRERGRAATDGAHRRRLDAPLPAGRAGPGRRRSPARPGPRGGPRSEGVRHRRPHRAVPGSASRMEQGAGRVARD